jgi:ribosomal protein S14
MASLAIYIKDKKQRITVANYVRRRLFYRYLINDLQLHKYIRVSNAISFCNSKKPKKRHIVRIRNRAIYTARARSTYRITRLSRMQLRELINLGLLPGFRKAIW